jgi:hypothetical protein
MENYGEFCRIKNCEHFIEWEFAVNEETQPYQCESCKLIGQSYSVNEYPENCQFKSEIEHFKIPADWK